VETYNRESSKYPARYLTVLLPCRKRGLRSGQIYRTAASVYQLAVLCRWMDSLKHIRNCQYQVWQRHEIKAWDWTRSYSTHT